MSNWKKFVFASDIHGSEQDVKANKELFSFIRDFRPDIRVMGGDLFDFAALRKKASEEERRYSIRGDFEAGRQWLDLFHPTAVLLGNHDKRLWDLAKKDNGPLSDYGKTLVEIIEGDFKKFKCPSHPWTVREGIVHIGHLKCLHGFASGVNATTKMAHAYGSCLFGHGHGIMMTSVPGYEERTARMVGCLCRLNLEYAESDLGSLLWRHGWAYGVVNTKTGNYEAFQAQEIDGKFILAKGINV